MIGPMNRTMEQSGAVARSLIRMDETELGAYIDIIEQQMERFHHGDI
jgi:hypothetical protein